MEQTGWSWTTEETECFTLRILAGHLSDIAKELCYSGIPGLDNVIDDVFRASLALTNAADRYDCEC